MHFARGHYDDFHQSLDVAQLGFRQLLARLVACPPRQADKLICGEHSSPCQRDAVYIDQALPSQKSSSPLLSVSTASKLALNFPQSIPVVVTQFDQSTQVAHWHLWPAAVPLSNVIRASKCVSSSFEMRPSPLLSQISNAVRYCSRRKIQSMRLLVAVIKLLHVDSKDSERCRMSYSDFAYKKARSWTSRSCRQQYD